MAKRKKIRVTARGRHAVTAMVEIAQQNQETPLPLSRIAAAGDISLSYLEQLFAGLRKHGLVRSFRGPGGGYVLAKPPAEILVADILLSAEDSAPARRSQDEESKAANDNPRTRVFWGQVDEMLYAFLRHISLADIVGDKLESHAFMNNLFETLE